MSVVYYAMGGGLGHLTRARAVAPADAVVVTSSRYADDERVTRGLTVAQAPAERAAFCDWFGDLLRQLSPEAIWLDSFPAGVTGELCDLSLPDVPVHLVARRLRIERYLRRVTGAPPRIDHVHEVEPLSPRHAEWLDTLCRTRAPLDLPEPEAGEEEPEALWLVVHSGPEHEVAELARRAERARLRESADARLVLVTQAPPAGLAPGVEVLDAYPAAPLFPRAERIVTACGFNTMRELRPYAERHRFVPFERPLDDQHGRASVAARPPAAAR